MNTPTSQPSQTGGAQSGAPQTTPQPPPAPPVPPAPLLFPPPLQNVETFGSFLGEEIVANWRRSLERTILSQNAAAAAAAVASLASPPPASAPSTLPASSAATPGPEAQTATSSARQSGRMFVRARFRGGNSASISDPSDRSPFRIPSGVGRTCRTFLANPRTTVYHSNGSSRRPSDAQPHGQSPHQRAPSEISIRGPSINNNNNGFGLGSLGSMIGPVSQMGQPSLPMNLNGPSSNGGCNNGSNGGNIPQDSKSPVPFRFDDHRSPPFRFLDSGPGGPMGGLGGLVGGVLGLGESLIPKGDPMEARLQEMLRHNMDRHASQTLDTLGISRRVRELLSAHNIGQRLFAKYVLGLSQGTVSELLSKPKPWDKLTEKGRDSYRKMHGWACDDAAVLLLKSLIPKK
ncbi:hypothetical protein J437_LFUL005739, partial [Ladona fulva]